MRKNTRWGLFLFCFIYWCISITHLSALDPAKRLSQYQLDVWNVERGFPDDLVNSVVQTKDGYIWLGTRDGLVRFDGSRFTVFNIDNTPELEDNVIRYLYEDPQGTLWIGTPNGGLSFLKNGAFKTFPASEYPALNGISCIISGDKGETWISTFKNGISRVEKGNFESFNTGSGLPSDAVYTLETDIDGNLWMGTPKGLCKRTPPGDFVTYTKENGMQSDFVFSLQAQKDGGLWIGGYNCLSFFDGKTFTHFDTSETISNPTIISLYLDSSQTLWLGTDGGGLARFKNGVFEVFGTEQGLGSGFIYSFMEDREGSMWLGTLDGGLLRLRDTKFTNFTVREGLTRDYVNCVYQDRAGTIWVGTELGADCFKNGTWSRGFPVSTVPAKSAVTSIVEDEKGYMWFGSGTGLHRTGKSGTVSYTKARGLPDDYVVSLTVDGAGDIWVGTQKGPACFSNGRFYTAVGNEAPAASVVSSILEDRFGTIWVGTTTGLYRLRKTLPEKNKPWDAQQVTGFPDNYIEAIVEDAEGVIFVGTHGGVSRMERGRWTHFNGRSGLVHDSVNCILEDANENLWLAGRQGIAWVAKKELSEFSQGKIEKIHPVFYNEQDGMKTRWCKRSGWKSRDGKLWFAGNKGVTMIHPGRIRRNTLHPPVVIEELLVDGLPVDISGKNGAKTVKLLPPGTVRLEFFYTALSFLNPRKVQFKLQLEGHDPDWIDVGNARSTIYTNLSPGEYTFRVMARNSDGTWNRTGASLELYKKPYFHQTPLFFSLLGVFLGVSVFSVYRLRMRHLLAREKRLSSLVRVRTKALEESYRIIEVKNRNIISSIEYAGRIQQAMLPGHERIRDLLADCFILFKPRDIVSGDFYWFYRKAHLLFIAVVDCTGHGVPGALLSMIGKIKLDEIVAEGTIHDPVSLLENLHTRVRGELHQEVEGNKTNDGMDVAMCMVDSKERKLFFTGAKRPLYYYGDSQLKEIKGDRKSIGGKQNNRMFSRHEIPLDTEKTIYLTSDGFVDQNDEENRKFSSRRFKQLLEANAHLDMPAQKEALLEELKSHRGKDEQRDDITILGIRFTAIKE